jgi:lysozyme
LLALAPAREARAATIVPGIDVSKWQGNVDWTAVGSTSTRFVIMRATIGNTPTMARAMDPKYLEYLAGATANGLVVGAYHRAHVGLAVNDARAEADYFVDHAQIEGGDILPVIDIEETHGLNPDQLVEWVRTWVQRVLARTGVHPMIYASPNFWIVNMGDSTWFADHGYPLWVADWRGNAAPEVRAGNWGGHGWTFWQWTSKGTVAGIDTLVDRDRFNGGNLQHGRIASVTVTPRPGGMVTGPRISCGGAASTCTRLADPDRVVTLTAVPDQGATLMRWTGACAPAGSAPTCDVTALGAKTASAVFGFPVELERQGSGAGTVTSSPSGLSCGATCTATFAAGSTIDLTATPDSASAFTGWSGGCAGLAHTCAVSISAPTTVGATFSSTVSVEQDGMGTAFGWGKAALAGAIGGSYRWDRRAGATISLPFSGGTATLFIVSGPGMGKARVSIDGNVVQTFDGYAPSVTSVAHRFEGLGAGAHVLSIRVLGTKRPASGGTRVAVDALRWGGTTVADPAASATWAPVSDAAASGGTYAVSDVRDAFSRLRFQGTGASARVRRGPGMGRAEIWADGALVRVVDLYAPAPGYATIALVSALADRWHTVRIVVDGSHRAASSGSNVTIDRWVVV